MNTFFSVFHTFSAAASGLLWPAQTNPNDFTLTAVLSTLVYGLIGILLYIVGYILFDKLLRLDLRRELLEDQNQALGIMMGGIFIGIAIVIAAAIL